MGWLTSDDADEIVDWFIENHYEIDDMPMAPGKEALDARTIIEHEFGDLGYNEDDVEQAILRVTLLGDLWIRCYD